MPSSVPHSDAPWVYWHRLPLVQGEGHCMHALMLMLLGCICACVLLPSLCEIYHNRSLGLRVCVSRTTGVRV